MGRIQSTRITATTNVVETLSSSHNFTDNQCVFNGLVISAIDADLPTGALGFSTISVYSDNTGTGTTNLVFRVEFKHDPVTNINPSETHNFTNGIFCRIGLRVEIENSTNIEVFVLHS